MSMVSIRIVFLVALTSAAAEAQLVRPTPGESASAWRAPEAQSRIVWIHSPTTDRALAQGGVASASQQPASSAGEQARERWQRVDDILRALNIAEGSTVADVGAGGGFFTVRLARIVGPLGRVYAVDVGRDVVTKLRERVAAEGLQNVEVIQSEPDDPRLPSGSLDAALIVNAYHEMPAHEQMLRRLRHALKPEGRLVLVEPISDARRDVSRKEQVRRHQIAPEFVTREARKARFDILGLEDPFTIKPEGDEFEWLLVLRPSRGSVASTSVGPPRASKFGSEPTETAPARDAGWKDPALRIPLHEFKGVLAENGVIVVDVRDAESYQEGHIPGALLIPLDEVEGRVAELRSLKKPIVTYCS